jgi:hypothetical protein
MPSFGAQLSVARTTLTVTATLVSAQTTLKVDGSTGAIGVHRDMTGGAKVDRNVPGATTGAGKASLTD